MLPVSLTLLDESLHALLLIFGGETRLEHASLEKKTVREALFKGLVDALLGHGDRWL